MIFFYTGRRRRQLWRSLLRSISITQLHRTGGVVRRNVSTKENNKKNNKSILNNDDIIEPTTKVVSRQQQQQQQQQQQNQAQSVSKSIPLSAQSSNIQGEADTSVLSSTTEKATSSVLNSLSSLSSSSSQSLDIFQNSNINDSTSTSTSTEKRAELYYDRIFRFWSERSGSSEILQLKESVNNAGLAFDKVSADVLLARKKLDDALRTWELASGRHMQLLQRRESWTPEDAQRFADLVTFEITSRSKLEQRRQNLAQSEESLTKSQLNYINKMRKRYHEENIWQDQWRVLGTYGTWTLIVLNSFVFLGSQYFLRLRETERMETIERLVLYGNDSNSNGGSDKENENENNRSDNNTSDQQRQHRQQTVMKRDAAEISTSTSSPSIATKGIVDTIGVTDKEKKESDNDIIENNVSLRKTGGEKMIKVDEEECKTWQHRIRFNKEQLLSSFQHQIRAVVPSSSSDIDVPSAMIGASVTGITILTFSIILSSLSGSSSSKRR
mmetsp:Transcript_38461/g.43945  ORF Transcript_38461/g.43945 Transcript_38461/m.43945 type:complete len:498 (-) Transcript_38461:92-1585(-)